MAIPKTDYDLEMVHVTTNIAAAMKALGATAENGGPWMVPFESLNILDGFNVRITDTPAYRQRVKDYQASIEANGFMRNKPFSAVLLNLDGKPTLFITDGHTRHESILGMTPAARKKVGPVPVLLLPPSTTTKELNAGLNQGNEGATLSMFEKAILAKRYETMGLKKAEIAEAMTISTKQVENLLTLAGAPTKIRALVVSNKLSGSDAVKMMRDHGDKAADVAQEALALAEASGKKKASRKHVNKTAAGKKKAADKAASKTKTKTPETPVTQEVGSSKPTKWKNGVTMRSKTMEDGRTVVEINGNFKAGTILPAKETVAARYLTSEPFWAFVDGNKDQVVIEHSVVISAEVTVFPVKPPAKEAEAGSVDAAIDGL